jgi:spermidine synthase
VLGVASGIGQALLLREAMAAMGGSELAWGTVMSLWLVGMAVGSRLGARHGGAALGRALTPFTLLLAGVGVVLFRAAPALTGATSGEAITTWQAAWLWAAAVVPPALAGGLAFPLLAGRLGAGGAGRGYGLEAGGALVGGLALSLLLAPLGTAAALCLTGAGVVLLGSWPRRRPASIALAAALAGAAVVSGDILAAAGWRWAGHPGELGAWHETRQQRLEVSSGSPAVLYADGRLAATFPDPFTTVPAAHLLMLLHPRPERVLAVGCLADGAITTMVRHPAAEIMVVESDPRLPPLLREWYGPSLAAALADPRVRVLATDPVRALGRSGRWDLIVLRDGNPITVRHNRTRTVEFFERCRARLADDGALVVRLEAPDTYLGGSAGRLVEVMASSLREVFPEVLAVPGESILLVAGGDAMAASVDPAELERRWRERGIEDELFAPEMLELLLDPRRAAELARVVDTAAAPLNTMEHPRAVLLAAGLHEARGRPSLLGMSRELEGRPATPLGVALAAAMAAVLVLSASRRQSATATAAVIGACSMGWWLLLIAAWQSTLGSVYAEIGALNAAFMAGLAAGSLAAARRPRPASRLPLMLLAGCLLSALLAFGAAFHLPALTVPVLLAAGGTLTGAAFAGVAELAGRGDTRRGAGVAFAADEAGAAIAALVVGILALPWAGMTATAVGLALLGLAALPGSCRAGTSS